MGKRIKKNIMTKTLFHTALAVIISLFSIQSAHAAINVNVSVEGVEGDIKKNVLALLSIEQQKKHQDLTESLLKKLHKKAPDEIRQALQPFGYYGPDIEAELVRKESTWNALYRINPGNPVIIHTIEVSVTGEGRDHKTFKRLTGNIPIKKGDIVNHQQYEKTRRLLHDTAMNSGFLKAQMVKSEVEVHAEKGIARVVIHFDTGPQFRFGKVTFMQNVFSQEFVARFTPFRKGDPYAVSRILDLQNALNNSDYFESVEIMPRREQAEDLEVPIDVKLVPRKRNKYTFGLGYGTDTGFRGSVGWEITRLNTAGHRFGITLKGSEIKSGITGEYTVPLRDPRTDSLVFSSGLLRENTETSESEKLFGGARFNHVIKGWKESIYLNYEEEDFDVADDEGRTTLLIPGISWTRIWTDSPVNTKRGLRTYLDIRGAHESLLSDKSFLQFRTQLKYIRGLWNGGRIIMRGEGGSSMVSEFSELPPSVRFFAGGDHSVRGYAYNSLGPEDESGDVAGGRHLLAGSIEYEQKIKGNWSGALFYDAGNAIDSFSDAIRSGAGFGVRWKSPVGPVRVDLGFPLSESDRDWRIHLSVGPDL
jgi:translocation and assembly module TamA